MLQVSIISIHAIRRDRRQGRNTFSTFKQTSQTKLDQQFWSSTDVKTPFIFFIKLPNTVVAWQCPGFNKTLCLRKIHCSSEWTVVSNWSCVHPHIIFFNNFKFSYYQETVDVLLLALSGILIISLHESCQSKPFEKQQKHYHFAHNLQPLQTNGWYNAMYDNSVNQFAVFALVFK